MEWFCLNIQSAEVADGKAFGRQGRKQDLAFDAMGEGALDYFRGIRRAGDARRCSEMPLNAKTAIGNTHNRIRNCVTR